MYKIYIRRSTPSDRFCFSKILVIQGMEPHGSPWNLAEGHGMIWNIIESDRRFWKDWT